MQRPRHTCCLLQVSIVNSENGSFVHRPVQPRETGTEYYVEHRGDEFYIITNANRPNYRVRTRVDFATPTL